MRQFFLFPHGGSANHGCEAIVRTTKDIFHDKQLTLFTSSKEEDLKYLGKDLLKIESDTKPISRISFGYFKAQVEKKLMHHPDSLDALYYYPIIKKLNSETILMSIGGDNYCYGDNEYIYLVNRFARKKNAKTILWGCSVDESMISEAMREDLRNYDMIFARESLSYNTLKCINENTYLYPDPAFTLKKAKGIYPEKMTEKPYIGINISPLIEKREPVKGVVLENYRNLIEYILKNTYDNIALIPHVVWDSNDDRESLKKVYNEFADADRVFFVTDQNCCQLKDIISGCRFFIGARTHATIAAYSSCVPTIVLGYSVKANGIAKDLFGTYENYVLPVQSLTSSHDLVVAFQWLINNEDYVRNHLQLIMKEYIERALKAGMILEGKL